MGTSKSFGRVDMSKDQFDDLLQRLEDCLNAESDEERENAESKLKTPHLISDQLKIMNSGIFLEGHLRGKPLTGSAKRYEKYQINDLEGLIAEVAIAILFINKDWSINVLDYITKLYLDFTSDDYDKLITFFRKRCISIAKKMEDIKDKFMQLRKALKNKINKSPKLTFKTTKRIIHENVDSLFSIFKAHIPGSHEETIADRISELLKEFDIDVKPGTILQRRRRAIK